MAKLMNTMASGRKPLRVMLVLSANDFERFFGGVFGLDRQAYVGGYRNDWAWQYSRLLLDIGIEPIIAVRSLGQPESVRTEEGVIIQFLPVGRLWRIWRHYGQARSLPRQSESFEMVDTHGQECLPARWILQFLEPCKRRSAPALSALRRYVSEAVSGTGSIRCFHPGSADVIYVQEYWTAQFDLIALTSRVPVVAGDHGGRALHQVKLLKRWALRRAVWVTCQTRREVETAQRYGARAELLSNPVDTQFYCPDESDISVRRPRTILVAARLNDSKKRISDIIRALCHLPDWTLDIAGTGPDREELVLLAERLGVADRVHFAGFVSNPVDLRNRYRACGVAVMASAHEGMPLAVLEALACGCAVVVSDIQPHRALAEECGDVMIRFPVGDVVALAKAVASAYEDRDTLGSRAREAAISYLGSDVFVRRLAALLNEAADTRRSWPVRHGTLPPASRYPLNL